MTEKNKGRPETGTAQKQENPPKFATTPNPLLGWHDLAKPSRDRQQKKSWKRKKGGAQ